VAPALKEAVLLSLADGEITVQLPAGILAETVERRRAEIEDALARFFGRATRLAVRTGTASREEASAAPLPAEAVPSIAQTEAAEARARSSQRQGTARSHPNIREAARILDGGIEDVEEL
jgi:uncharacterized protein (DUF1697 family)